MPGAARLRRALPYAAVAAGAGYLYHAAAGIEYYPRPGVLGPDFWPKAILVLALVVCGLKILFSILESAQPRAVVFEQFRRPHVARHDDGVARQLAVGRRRGRAKVLRRAQLGRDLRRALAAHLGRASADRILDVHGRRVARML